MCTVCPLLAAAVGDSQCTLAALQVEPTCFIACFICLSHVLGCVNAFVCTTGLICFALLCEYITVQAVNKLMGFSFIFQHGWSTHLVSVPTLAQVNLCECHRNTLSALMSCRCLAATQRHREAEMACRKAIAAHPSSPAAAMQLAAVLQSTGKDQDAVEAIKHAQDRLSSLDEASCQVSMSRVCCWRAFPLV